MSKFDRLGKALDRQAWLWLQDNHDELASALEAEMQAGADPENIRRFVITHAGDNRVGLADRIVGAARHLASQG